MIRCKYSHQKIEPINNRCPICTIEIGKELKDFTQRERQIRSKIIGVYITAYTHLFIAIILPFLLITKAQWVPIGAIGFGILHLVIWFLLSRFSLIGYRIAVGYYFMYGMVSVVTIQRSHFGEQGIGIILCFAGLYLIGNRISKGLFQRSLDLYEEVAT